MFLRQRRHPLRRAFLGAGVFAGSALAAGGCFAAVSPAASPRAAQAPSVVTAHRIPADRRPFPQPGSVVRSSSLGIRTFANARDGFALAEVTGSSVGGSATFPARTTDGGHVWRIDGPHLHVSAADAPDVVTGSGVGGPRIFFAFAGPAGGQAVDVTTDAGARWWRAYLPSPPVAVVYSRVTRPARLIAFLEGSPTLVYVSRDGGRHWRRTS